MDKKNKVPPKAKAKISVNMDSVLLLRIQHFAVDHQDSVSGLIDKALRQYLKGQA